MPRLAILPQPSPRCQWPRAQPMNRRIPGAVAYPTLSTPIALHGSEKKASPAPARIALHSNRLNLHSRPPSADLSAYAPRSAIASIHGLISFRRVSTPMRLASALCRCTSLAVLLGAAWLCVDSLAARAQSFDLDRGREPVVSLDGPWRFHPGDSPPIPPPALPSGPRPPATTPNGRSCRAINPGTPRATRDLAATAGIALPSRSPPAPSPLPCSSRPSLPPLKSTSTAPARWFRPDAARAHSFHGDSLPSLPSHPFRQPPIRAPSRSPCASGTLHLGFLCRRRTLSRRPSGRRPQSTRRRAATPPNRPQRSLCRWLLLQHDCRPRRIRHPLPLLHPPR